MLGWHLLASWSWPKFWSVLPRLGAAQRSTEHPQHSIAASVLTGAYGHCHKFADSAQWRIWVGLRRGQRQIMAWATLAPYGNKQYPTLACSSCLAVCQAWCWNICVNHCLHVKWLKAVTTLMKTYCLIHVWFKWRAIVHTSWFEITVQLWGCTLVWSHRSD